MKIPELEQALLRAARESLGPSQTDRQRHEAALLARLDAPAASETGLRPPMHSETRSILGAPGALARAAPRLASGRLELLSAGLAVGVVLGGVVGFGLGRSGFGADREHASPPSRVEQREARAESGAPKEPDRATGAAGVNAGTDSAASAEAEPEAVASPELVVEPVDAVTTRRMRPPRARQHEKAKPESSLAIELAMLQRARRALGADNGRLALGIVQELEERFPKGVLMEERRATRVLSLCLLGRTDEARQHGSEFLAQHPSSVYAERVRASCAVAGR